MYLWLYECINNKIFINMIYFTIYFLVCRCLITFFAINRKPFSFIFIQFYVIGIEIEVTVNWKIYVLSWQNDKNWKHAEAMANLIPLY